MEIREATPDDWPQIWPIFSDVVQAGETYAFDPAMTSDEAQALWMERPPGHTVVALVDDTVVGTAKMGPNRPAGGAHVGTASFNAVVETNTAAVALWQSVGFEIVGTVPGAFHHPTQGYVGLHVMHLSLV